MKPARDVCSHKEKPRSYVSTFSGSAIDDETFWGVSHHPSCHIHLPLGLVHPFSGSAKPEVFVNRLGGKGARPKNTTFLDIYMPDGKGTRLSQVNPRSLSMLLKVGNPLVIIKLVDLMEKYGTPFFRVDKLTGELHTMEANSMAAIPEKAKDMPQVSNTAGRCPSDPFETFRPFLRNGNMVNCPCC